MSRNRALICGAVGLIMTPLVSGFGTGYAEDNIRPASCPCEQRAVHGMHAVPEWQPQAAHAPPPGLLPQPSQIPPPALNVPPPPGTLGHTYQRRSWRIPVDRHPRVAMLDVTVAGASEVHVYTTNEYRLVDELDGFQDPDDPDVWHFETDPLIPGLPHVYRIEAAGPDTDPSMADVRYVRLIRGRRVTLEY